MSLACLVGVSGISACANDQDPQHLAAALRNQSGIYRKQGKYAEAEPFYKRALTINEKALDPNNPDVATNYVLTA